MKMKCRILNRICSIVLALVLVAGLVPMMSLTANAVEVKHAETGIKFTANVVYCTECDSPSMTIKALEIVEVSFPEKNEITIKYRYKLEHSGSDKCRAGYWVDKELNDFFHCDETYENTYLTMYHVLKVTRKAGHICTWESTGNNQHSGRCLCCKETVTEDCVGDATCTTSATCKICKSSYIDTDNHKPESLWTTDTEAKTHYHACENGCGQRLDEDDCAYSEATCEAASACETCKHTYAEKKSHNYTVTKVDSETLEQRCGRGCGHHAIASLSAVDAVYTGAPITNTTSVNYSGDAWAGKKPELNFTDNLNVGLATAALTADGESIIKIFRINKGSGSVTNISDISKTYDGTAVTAPTFDKLSSGDATIEYKELNADDSTYTTTPPVDVGDYVVRVTVAGDDNCREASATDAFSIARASLEDATLTLSDDTFTYNGESQKPGVAVTMNGVTLIEGVDYLSYVKGEDIVMTWSNGLPTKFFGPAEDTTDCIDVGKYYVIISGKDNYLTETETTLFAEYEIKKAENSWTTAPSIEDWAFGQKASKPTAKAKFGTVSVKYSGTANDGTEWDNETAPTKPGDYTATFTVEGTKNYTGLEKSVDFTVKKIEEMTFDNVTPDDKSDLKGLKSELENSLEENGDSYTDDEKQAIEDALDRIDDALEIIDNVETVEQMIENLPETITKNDKDAINAADKAYKALTKYEKSLVNEDAKKALDKAKSALAKLNKSSNSGSPNTGDARNLWLWTALLFVSGSCIFGFTRNECKKKVK